MCGIFGALTRLDDETVAAVGRAIHHRGPDLTRAFVDDQISLVHARLKVIDLSEAASQPMATEDGSIRVVFNGEIYNHHTLRRELEGRFPFRTRSDTEAILRGYEAWGEDLVHRLDGMFAFAIWDAPKRRLLLARDRAGKKPLFHAQHAGTFRFASTVGALLASGVPASFDAETLPYYLNHGYMPAPRTAHAGVSQLDPGSTLVVERGTVSPPRRYWAPRFGLDLARDGYDVARYKVRALVEAAVERRLESDVPLGAFLSGGIDSTIIVAVMRRKLGAVRTFSIGFAGDPRYDETSFARLAADRLRTTHTEFVLEPSSIDLVETLVRHHEAPFGDSSAIPTYVVSQMTRRHVTVAMTGDGGDELFCGYQRFRAAELSEHVPAAARARLASVSRFIPAPRERSLLGKARRFLSGLDGDLLQRLERWTPFFADPDEILRPELRGKALLRRPRDPGRPVLHDVLDDNFRGYLPGDLLVKADRCSMAHALELRAPFLDTALIEYVERLPPSYLRRGTRLKRILKDAFADVLPGEIASRGKMGFGVPIGTWFRNDLRAYLRDRLAKGARIDSYLERSAIDQLLHQHGAGTHDHGQRLWALLTLEVWLRTLAS